MTLTNMKLGVRLTAGFGAILALMTAVVAFTIWSGGQVEEVVRNKITNHLADSTYARSVKEVSYENANAVGRLLVETDTAIVAQIEGDIAVLKARNDKVIAAINEHVKLDPDLKRAFEGMSGARDTFIGARAEAMKLLKAGRRDEAVTRWNGDVAAKLKGYREAIDAFVSFTEKRVDADLMEIRETLSSNRYTVIAGLVVALILGGVLALLITRSITRPLGRGLAVAEAVAAGKLDNVIDTSAKDETGQLLSAMAKMQGVIKEFVAAQGEMKARHDDGLISHRIDAKQFVGSYGEMAKMTNDLVGAHIAVKMRIVEVVSQYAKGDLSLDMDKLPGEKAKITTAMDGVKASLQAVAAQIQTLVEAAGRGDFTVRGDEAKFEHEFRKMVAGLNRLMQTSDTGLNEVSRVLGALAKGDLTEKITNDYHGTFGQLKDDANKTVENLTQIIHQIKEASETINTASGEIFQGNTDLSQRTEEQASSLEETASSMEELTSTVKQNADNARQANQLAVSASDVAVKGGDVVKQVVTTMSGISEASKKIADIIGTIDGIAFQTNILALNAAVEAARAGEQGRGFAVVASEVRNLAQRSANAAKEIKELITDSVSKVDTGTQLVDEAGKTMDEIVTSVKRVTDIMAEITAASQEQSSGIEQVNQAITQMDEVTQQNAALVEEAAAAAESMQEQAGTLVQSVAQFKMAHVTKSAPKIERAFDKTQEPRTPLRPSNVARLSGKAGAKPAQHAQPVRIAAANAPLAKKVAGGTDDWQEF